MQLISFAEANSEQLKELSKIHVQSIPFSMNAQLGDKHINSIYRSLQESKEIIGFVAVKNNQAIGLILAARNYGVTAIQSKHFHRTILKKLLTIRFLAKNLINIFDLLSLKFKYTNNFLESSYLMLLFVKKDWSRKGIGKLLLNELCSNLYKRNYKSIIVDVRKTSLSATRFYHKSGFERVSNTLYSQILIRKLQ